MCKNDLDDLKDGVQVVNCAKDSRVQLSEQQNISLFRQYTVGVYISFLYNLITILEIVRSQVGVEGTICTSTS